MARAFEELFGIPNAFGSIPMPGRTDFWLLRRALDAHAISNDDPRVSRFRDRYLQLLESELDAPPPARSRKQVLPGVRELLEVLTSQNHAYLGLLTGNYERAARLKLEHFDLWRYFQSGAFGDDTTERNELLMTAIEQAGAAGGRSFHPSESIVIGDTPHDVAVAKAGGARSIAVATGSHTVQELKATGADHVFEDLSDLAAVMRAFDHV